MKVRSYISTNLYSYLWHLERKYKVQAENLFCFCCALYIYIYIYIYIIYFYFYSYFFEKFNLLLVVNISVFDITDSVYIPYFKARVTFLEDKPHVKGIINSITFTPWDESCFVTGGSDHAVVLWNEQHAEDSWKPKALHRSMHSSAVMGVAGMQHKKIVISVGADKRIIGYDLACGRADYKHQIESKGMSVLPNPCDFNLFMVQTGTPERQLRLFDIRVRQMELHSYGWKQESSESQSALINQAWSPDGLYITSGSADPAIHVFDIRYNARKPSQSIRAHQKRVFKAIWHHALPLLISISSDLQIGLHRII
ncbi:U5 small nuclear ribonucleo 40 kDa [Olea europaea subsp. europaea]|uniref:U5 small nuclear ribonucleo 40 kDa n=1 Tax=Olea europaea subsp. europaea TaxID=158383 RepID=A0A8S0VNU7_OLEEU|nr:U5 small nuclear ribonucleo 40 kDa [Olea europaea subsp. europaea]